jgi:MoaA/NifB/PqqE/SkfB family radical SAM enzyme
MKALQMSVNEQQESTMVIEKSELQQSVSDVIADKVSTEPFRIPSGQHHVHGWNLFLLKRKFRLQFAKMVLQRYGFSRKAVAVIRNLKKKNIQIHGPTAFRKWVHASGKNYFYLYAAGYPSASLQRMMQQEMDRLDQPDTLQLRFAFLAITKKCALRCEHCFEWDNINQKEVLSYADLRNIVLKLIDAGITQLHLSGGEPLLRVIEIVQLAKEFSSVLDIWVLTSGFNGTAENIALLKESGVCGFAVSIDHYLPEEHDRFRKHSGSFEQATQTIHFARALDMPVALSVCTTRAFCTEEHLHNYLELARQLDVSFVQILEPKAVGNYSGKDVLLQEHHIRQLESFYLKYNRDVQYKNYPIIVYHGYYQRRSGCFTAGNRALYIDTNGDAMSCPFCQCSSGNLLREDAKTIITRMRMKGCSTFGISTI